MHTTHTPLSERLSERTDEYQGRASAAIDRIAARANETARVGAERLREGTGYVKDRLSTASDSALGYVRDEPVRSILVAAAVGGAVMLLASWLMSSSRRRRGH